MFLVVIQHLALTGCWPILSRRDALLHLAFNFLQILDPVTRKIDLPSLRRHGRDDVVLLAMQRASVCLKRLVLSLKVPILDRDGAGSRRAGLA